MIYAYLYIDPRNSDPFYVGKGSGSRARRHLVRKDKHPLTQRIQKMLSEGITPVIDKIEVSSNSEALELERFLISLIGRKDQGTGTLLNLTDGGENPPSSKGKVMSEVQKQHIRETHKSFGIKHWMKNPESRAKMVGNKNGAGKRAVVVCNNCGKSGGKPLMTRYHFDNCKSV